MGLSLKFANGWKNLKSCGFDESSKFFNEQDKLEALKSAVAKLMNFKYFYYFFCVEFTLKL